MAVMEYILQTVDSINKIFICNSKKQKVPGMSMTARHFTIIYFLQLSVSYIYSDISSFLL